MKRQDRFKRRALIERRNRVNREQAALREAKGTTLATESKPSRESVKQKISASMKEMWARKLRERLRDAGIPDEDTEGVEHAGSPDSELDTLNMLLGTED